MVDGGSLAQVTLELFVEAEDGALAAAVDVASTATAGDKAGWQARVETGERGWSTGAARVGGLGVLEVDDVSTSATAGVDCWATGMGDRWVRLNDAVI